MLAKLFFAVVLDTPQKADTQVHEVDALGPVAPIDDLINGFHDEFGRFRQAAQLDRLVHLGRGAGRNGKHDEIGAPSHALRVELETGQILSGENAGHCGAVGKLGSNFIGCTEEKALDDIRVQELGVCAVNPRINHADGDAVAGRGVGPQLKFQMRIGSIGANRRKPPLVLEARPLSVLRCDFVHQFLVLGLGCAALLMSLDAGRLGTVAVIDEGGTSSQQSQASPHCFGLK